MKTLILFLCAAVCLSASAQNSNNSTEIFLGVPVIKHHTVIHPGDSIRLPSNAYIIEIIMIRTGDYVVYNDGSPFIYPGNEGVNHIVYRNEGSYEIDGQIKTKTFDLEGNERYSDEAICSRDASFHLYYFTLAREPIFKMADVNSKR